ncbi:monooxygenase [Mycobacterium lentiflavum]|uniref:Monooxygenase n=1 Tax=Mycobacterium lentiflavum TaxID=141349 RepID=A0A0E4CMD9_MYCLN|nr:TIGR03560 family F420-dependent LLM class oxidoreductase [Mycobacterium lentiflavum]CQD09106.1 monooxygenase [Mycobacterium lentiflavum]
MKLGLHLDDYSWRPENESIAQVLSRIAVITDEGGFARLSVTDHVWQTSAHGVESDPMLEAYTTLAFLAARTATVELLTLVSAVTYRPPGLVAKMVTTLDILSGGRAMLGIGAGWNEEEATGLGLSFAPNRFRFERLEEALQICLQMFSESTRPYRGKHYTLASTLNSPLSTPRPRILVGGGGERRTLRLAARYADACNVYGGPSAGHKLQVLREQCQRAGRDFDEIEKTAILPLDPGGPGGIPGLLQRLAVLRDLGFDSVLGAVPGIDAITPLESLVAKVIPEVASW